MFFKKCFRIRKFSEFACQDLQTGKGMNVKRKQLGSAKFDAIDF